ncbi:MAG: hypothetical protein AAFV93_19920, partial [Chloroflexota bacterium]
MGFWDSVLAAVIAGLILLAFQLIFWALTKENRRNKFLKMASHVFDYIVLSYLLIYGILAINIGIQPDGEVTNSFFWGIISLMGFVLVIQRLIYSRGNNLSLRNYVITDPDEALQFYTRYTMMEDDYIKQKIRIMITERNIEKLEREFECFVRVSYD